MTEKELEEIIKELDFPIYPKYLGNGLWKIADNCITGEKGMKLFNEQLRKTVKDENNKS